MEKRFLLTSFDIWLPHHESNSSDDLLKEVANLHFTSGSLTFLRKLPVDIGLASSRVIEKISELHPHAIICCGMAEKRTLLSVEKVACCDESVLQTSIDLEQLVTGATAIDISYDCGKFVCEGLYYSVLDYLGQLSPTTLCVFVHVPILTAENSQVILDNFLVLLHNLALS
jgi:pyroglutamyl-peptidase